MLRKSFGSVLVVIVLSTSTVFAAERSREQASVRERDRDQPFISKVIRVVKAGVKRVVVGNSFLVGDPRP